MKDKFYYIDSDNNKKKYVGKIIETNGIYSGVLTKNKEVVNIKELIYHPEVESVEGYFSYYSYTNSLGEEIKYFDNIKKDENGNVYFSYIERNSFNLDYHEEVEPKQEYYTYIDPKTKEEKLYEGTVIYNKINNTYQGVIQR